MDKISEIRRSNEDVLRLMENAYKTKTNAQSVWAVNYWTVVLKSLQRKYFNGGIRGTTN